MRKFLAVMSMVIVLCLFASPVLAKVPMGFLYYNEKEVRTLIPPAAMPHEGRDNLYEVPDQFAVAAVAPGDKDYHGGAWAVHTVTWNVGVYPLKSEAAVLAAAALGDITITREPAEDFRCPIQGPIPK